MKGQKTHGKSMGESVSVVVLGNTVGGFSSFDFFNEACLAMSRATSYHIIRCKIPHKYFQHNLVTCYDADEMRLTGTPAPTATHLDEDLEICKQLIECDTLDRVHGRENISVNLGCKQSRRLEEVLQKTFKRAPRTLVNVSVK